MNSAPKASEPSTDDASPFVIACLVALNIKTEDGKRFDSGTKNAMFKLLRNALDTLLGGDLLNGKSRSVLVVNRGYIEVLTRNLVAEKKFTAMADTLQKTLNLSEEEFAQEPSLSMDQLMAGMRILFGQQHDTSRKQNKGEHQRHKDPRAHHPAKMNHRFNIAKQQGAETGDGGKRGIQAGYKL